eukprot:12056359-Heterocapsa_arctica.AAC.1
MVASFSTSWGHGFSLGPIDMGWAVATLACGAGWGLCPSRGSSARRCCSGWHSCCGSHRRGVPGRLAGPTRAM